MLEKERITAYLNKYAYNSFFAIKKTTIFRSETSHSWFKFVLFVDKIIQLFFFCLLFRVVFVKEFGFFLTDAFWVVTGHSIHLRFELEKCLARMILLIRIRFFLLVLYIWDD